MFTTVRQWLRALLVLALLWQAGSAPAAALMGCCDQPQPCCIAAPAASAFVACAACAACAPAAVPVALPSAGRPPALRQAAPDHCLEADSSAVIDTIWRPPMSTSSH